MATGNLFEDQLNSASIVEDVDVKILFESFMLKRNDSTYNFIYLTHDLDAFTTESEISGMPTPRFIVKSKECLEVDKFLGIPIMVREGLLHTTIAQILAEDKNRLTLLIFEHEDYDVLKKLSLAFISKHPDVSVNLKLESTNPKYTYAEIEEKNFWKLVKEFFIRTSFKEF